jgi:hypothetical protein
VCGADSASLYLEVKEVLEHDVVCEAKNDAVLDGLLTVFHVERSHDEVVNVQVGGRGRQGEGSRGSQGGLAPWVCRGDIMGAGAWPKAVSTPAPASIRGQHMQGEGAGGQGPCPARRASAGSLPAGLGQWSDAGGAARQRLRLAPRSLMCPLGAGGAGGRFTPPPFPPLQNDLPILSEYDVKCLQLLAEDYDLDFISLSYTRCATPAAAAPPVQGRAPGPQGRAQYWRIQGLCSCCCCF